MTEKSRPKKVEHLTSSRFEELDDQTLIEVSRAARQVLKWQGILDKTGDSITSEFLRGVNELTPDKMYPEETVEDNETGCQYYFHAHQDREEEYGHFHTYVMEKSIPNNLRALQPASVGNHADPWRTHCHLVGISIAEGGRPAGLFTLNHWSSQEAKYKLEDLEAILAQFDVTHAFPSYPVNRWITALVRMYRPVILHLFAERERFLDELEQPDPSVSAMDNEAFDVTSSVEIGIESDALIINREILGRGLS